MYPTFKIPSSSDIANLLDLTTICRDEVLILLQQDEFSWNNFVEPLRIILCDKIMNHDTIHASILGSVGHYSTIDTQAIQQVFEEISNIRFEFFSWIDQQYGICEALNKVKVGDDSLSELQHTWLDSFILGYEQDSLPLSQTDNDRSIEIQHELNTLQHEFENNFQHVIDEWTFEIETRKQLVGIPNSMLAEYQVENSKWLLNLTDPCVNMVLTYCEDRELRKFFFESSRNICSNHVTMKTLTTFSNTNIVVKLLNLRNQQSKLVGFNTTTEFVLDSKMVRTCEDLQTFINNLLDRLGPTVLKEEQELAAVGSIHGIKDIEPWDVKFLSYKAHQFDSTILNEYFSINDSIPKMLTFIETLFNVQFKRRETTIDPSQTDLVHVWNEDVQFHEVYRDGELMGGIYFDFVCRLNKHSTSVWMESIYDRNITTQRNTLPLAAMISSFDRNGQLTLDDVKTFMHEMGHCLHHVLNSSPYNEFSSNNVEWDTVEVPSMFLETYANNMQFLREISCHWITKQQLPVKLIQSILSTMHYRKASDILFECRLITMDLLLHNNKNEFDNYDQIVNVVRHCNDLLPFNVQRYSNDLCSFSHIFSGEYSSCYYSYLWAENLVSKMVVRIQQDPTFLQKFTSIILEGGSIRSFDEMWNDLIPDDDPFNVDCLMEYHSIHEK